MLGGIDAAHVYIVCGYTDMRRSIDGLAAIVKQNFGCNPYDGSLFLFCGNGKIVSKYNNIIKISCILGVPINYLLSDQCAFDKPGTISNILEVMSEFTHDDIQHFILYIDFYKNEKKFLKK